MKPQDDKNLKRPRLVFTDIQRRTLHAIFKETKRPSKEMQATIAQQLELEVSTVANFFMNARRRSSDKWQDDSELMDDVSISPVHSMDPSSPSTSQNNQSGISEPPTLQPVSDALSQILTSNIDSTLVTSLSSAPEFSASPAPARLTPDTSISLPTSSLTRISTASGLSTQVSPSSGLLAGCSTATTMPSQLLTHSVMLPGGQSAIIINGDDDNMGLASLPNSSTCLISSSGVPVSLSAFDSFSLPNCLFSSSTISDAANIFRTPSDNCRNVSITELPQGLLTEVGGIRGLLPSAATLITHDRHADAECQPSHETDILCSIKPENVTRVSGSSHVGISINPKK